MRRHFGFKHRYAYKYLEIEDFTERPFGNTGRREIATKVAVKKRPRRPSMLLDVVRTNPSTNANAGGTGANSISRYKGGCCSGISHGTNWKK